MAFTSQTTHLRITASNAAGGTEVAAANADHRTGLILQASVETCYVTFDGTAPTATNGIAMAAGTNYIWGTEDRPPGGQIRAFSTGGTGVVNGAEFYQG